MAADHVATGDFTVSMAPEDGRVRVTKAFTGGFTGTATGTMLTEMTPEQGSAAYVLIERLEGTLAGRQGSFALAHLGLMDQGAADLRIALVPGSGTGAFAGIRGHMILDRSGGGHRYAFHCTLPSD